MYPFGTGISYTTFEQHIENYKASTDSITFDVVVTNTGDVAGRDVVQVYNTPPYYNGGIEKAAVNLVDFEKTDTLEPGASQTFTFNIALEDLASFDAHGRGCYVLEAGEYVISIRANAHEVIDSVAYTAAIEAREAGAEVILLEKLGRVGGSSVLSGGNFYATGSSVNREYENDAQAMAQYLMDRSEGLANEELITYYAEHSGENVDWLIEHLGTDYGTSTGSVGYSDALRQHFSVKRGAGLTVPAYELCKSLGVNILLETPATELLTDENGNICGVKAKDAYGTVSIACKAVVLASGGYDRSDELLEKYSPLGLHSVHTSANQNTGDGLVMAMDLGADTVFRGIVGGIQTINEWVYMEDGINLLVWFPTLFITDEGNRFVNESEWYTTVYDEMAKLDRPAYYWVFDSSTSPELCEETVAQGYGVKADTIEELAEGLNIDAATLAQTVAQYNQAAVSGNDELFGRKDFAPLSEEGPYYGIHVLMATCDSIGGLITDVDAEVLRNGEPIPGLYAAGEIANGQFFGNTYSSDGTMIGLSTTFGRVAGVNAAQYALK